MLLLYLYGIVNVCVSVYTHVCVSVYTVYIIFGCVHLCVSMCVWKTYVCVCSLVLLVIAYWHSECVCACACMCVCVSASQLMRKTEGGWGECQKHMVNCVLKCNFSMKKKTLSNQVCHRWWFFLRSRLTVIWVFFGCFASITPIEFCWFLIMKPKKKRWRLDFFSSFIVTVSTNNPFQ